AATARAAETPSQRASRMPAPPGADAMQQSARDDPLRLRVAPEPQAQASADGFERLLVAIVGGTRPAGPALRSRLGFLFLTIFLARNRRRQDTCVESRFFRLGRSLGSGAVLGTASAARTARSPCIAHERIVRRGRFVGFFAFDARLALGHFRPLLLLAFAATPRALAPAAVSLGGRLCALCGLGFVAVEGRFAIVVAPRPRVFLRRAAVGHETEVVIGKLQVVLGQHAIAVERCIVSKLFVLFGHLGRIAPRPAVDPVALVAAALTTIVAAAAPTIVIAILVQRNSASLTMTGTSRSHDPRHGVGRKRRTLSWFPICSTDGLCRFFTSK